jgi:hypothetical protein
MGGIGARKGREAAHRLPEVLSMAQMLLFEHGKKSPG